MSYLRTCFFLFIVSSVTGCAPSVTREVYTVPKATEVELQSTQVGDEVFTTASEPQPWKARAKDEIAPGFEIALRCKEDAKLNGNFTVAQDGMLRLPYEVKVWASGRTLSEVEKEIKTQYSKFLTSPAIDLSIVKRQYYVEVRGLVGKPGQYLVDAKSSLDEVLANAGGVSQNAAQPAEWVKINQLGVSNVVKLRDYYSGRTDLVPQWQGGETIFVQSERGDIGATQGRNYVQVLGQVKTPGEYPYQEGADFYDYITQAGGPNDRADTYNINLLRKSSTEREVITFGLQSADKIPAIRPGDVFLVNADIQGPVEKRTRQVGGIMQIVTMFATLALLFTTAN